MKLTDDKIKKMADTKSKSFAYLDGMYDARDFYEKQTCMNCYNDIEISSCLIYLAMREEHKLNGNEYLDTDKCRCSLWKPRT